MSVTRKLKWKRTLATLRFCYEELEYVKEAASTSAAEFETYYRRFCVENNINVHELDKQNKQRIDELYGRHEITDNHAEHETHIEDIGDTSIVVHNKKPLEDNEEYQMTTDEIAIHEAFSKLYKKIALKLHPDRLNKNLPEDETKSRINMFQKANRAFEDKKYYFLLDVAERYSISTPRNYEQQARWMKREADKVAHQIQKEKNTYNYGFSECETDEERDALIRKFIFQLFRVVV